MEVKEVPVKTNSFELLRADNRTLLGKFLPSELRTRSGVRVLSVACGLAPEAIPIRELLPNARFEAIDIRADLISGATAFHRDIPSVCFRVADATKPESFGKEPWDLIILRNPQIHGEWQTGYTDMTEDWARILSNCEEHLSKGGYIYLACAEKEEINRVNGFFKQKKMKPVVEITPLGPFYLQSNFPNREEYVAVLQKL